MGERKVLNKYYPPDFDPSKIPKRKQLKNLQMKVRMMLPMSICCNTCGNFMYMGTKFNCRKEDVVGETYLGLMKFRFYFKCTKCSAELCMKTDPQNSDYEMEFGASRNFEPWREKEEVKEALKKQREEEEKGDAMKALENRTLDSKTEMDILASLDEVKSLKSRQAKLDPDELLAALQRSAQAEQEGQQKTEQQLEEEDEQLVKSIVFRNSQAFVRRIEDDDDEEEEDNGEAGGAREGEGGGSERGAASGTGIGGSGLDSDLLSGSGGPGKRLGSTAVSEDKAKKQKLADSPPSGNGSAAGSSKQANGPSESIVGATAGGLLIKKVEEQPVFEVRPLKVAFAVREKKKPQPGNAQASSVAASKGTSLNGSTGTHSHTAPAPVPSAPKAPVGLSLLSANYSDSEGSE